MRTTEHPFLERVGVKEPDFMRELYVEPERPLSKEQAEAVKEFARGLFEGAYQDLAVDLNERLDLKTIEKIPAADTQTFALAYFDTEAGKVDAKALGLTDVANAQDYLTDIFSVNAVVTSKQRKEIATRSLRWRDQKMIDLLTQTPSELDAEFSEASTIEANYKPELLLKKFNSLYAYRHFLKQVRERLEAQENAPEREIELALTDMYQGRITELIGGLYSSVITIAKQLERHPELEAYDHIGQQLEEAAPTIIEILLNNENPDDFLDAIDRTERRLDYVRNGAALSEDGLTPIAPEVAALITQDSHNSHEFSPLLSPEIIESLKKTTWGAEQTKALADAVLKRLGVLSAVESSWQEVSERYGPAEDDKYQVIVDPTKKTSLSVDTLKKVIYIGAEFSRGLIDRYPAGVLPVVAHEVLHVLQGLVDEKVSQTIPLAIIKGRRYLTVREGGGIANEQTMHRRYFGQDRKTNPYYALALQAKLTGKNRLQVARTFYDALVASSDFEGLGEEERQTKLAKNAETAVDRSNRLYRHGGYNSQPLNYIEQELIARNLAGLEPEERNKFLLRLGSFNVKDAAVLHRYGLYPAETAFDRIDLPSIVIETYLSDFAEKI